MNFWQKLVNKKQPFLALAPMEDATDVVFRQIVEQVAPPDVFFTEFTNVEAILHGELSRLKYHATKIPTVAQIWGTEPDSFYKAAKLISDMNNFSGIDINMGCPQKPEMKIGACAALINNHTLAGEIIAAVKQGTTLPVSVKTRIGTKKIATEDWLGFLLNQKLSAITVHGRTAKEMSGVPAHWDEIAKVVSLRNEISPETIVIGNGDVKNALDAKNKWQTAKVDGIMIGRGVFENIGCFKIHDLGFTIQERINLLKKHVNLWDETWGAKKNFSVLKKYVKIYIRDFDGASDLRAKLMSVNGISDIMSLLGEVA